ncbi:PREDICTED: uncharacterized protein LOC100640013, partial [Amphimedon queenslandica]|uniref:histone acetyltransferase n=2 Tax=Amphimedon queenslandica TaxID=400682 RepID=A0AAN0IJA9_AMPQE
MAGNLRSDLVAGLNEQDDITPLQLVISIPLHSANTGVQLPTNGNIISSQNVVVGASGDFTPSLPSRQPPIMGGGQPSSASNDPEKTKLIQQQLVLLLHAHRCQQIEREKGTLWKPCQLPHCRTMKNVLNHMTDCQAGRDCQFPHCASSRQIIYHWKNCNQQECPVCLPLKNTTRPNVGGSIGGVPNSMFGGDVPPVSLPPHLVPKATGAMAPGQNPPLPQKAGQPQGGGVGGVNPNPMGPAPGLPPSSTSGPMGPNQSIPPNQSAMPPNHVKAWHAEVNLDLRNHLIKKLVEAIYPVPNPNSMHDSSVKSLFQYAVKVENMMFENASSREDYYQKIAEKIYRVRKELDEKRQMHERRKGFVPFSSPPVSVNNVLQELKSSIPLSAMGGTYCNNCSTNIKFRWHCKECWYYNLCSTCYPVVGHVHPMEKLFPVSNGVVDKWLKEGSVELTVTRVNMHGPPGAGKTCAQHFLLNEDPPTECVTDSTPIARPTVRATRVSVDNLKWEKVTRAGLLERLASDLNVAAASQPEEYTESTSPLNVQAHQPEQHSDPIINSDSTSISNSDPVINSDLITDSDPDPVIINPTSSINSDSIEINETIVSNNQASSISNEANNDETETVIQEIIDTIQRSAVQLSGHWLYIIDSGGQPAYQELLPLFIRTASLNIITLDLSQPLDRKLDFQYRIGGETFSCGLNLKYSNREFFQSAVSSGAILKPIDVPHVLETPSHPMHFVLGTHYDLISQDSLKKIDKELMSSLKPDIQNYVVHNKRGESIIFPINTLVPADKGRLEAGQKLCQSIANCGGTSLKMHMPIRWFAFELWLQKVAEKKSRNVLVIDEVISAGKRFKMSEGDTKDALQYLHSVTIVLYFHDILPQLVFIDPQPILEILSRLLALTYVERSALHLITNPVPLDEDINKLHNFGSFRK